LGGIAHAGEKLAGALPVGDVRRRQRAADHQCESERAVPSLEGSQLAVQGLAATIEPGVAIGHVCEGRKRLRRSAHVRGAVDQRGAVLDVHPGGGAFAEGLTKRLIEAPDGDVGGGAGRMGYVLRCSSVDQQPRSSGEVVGSARVRHGKV
jgi:hypothetical protein